MDKCRLKLYLRESSALILRMHKLIIKWHKLKNKAIKFCLKSQKAMKLDGSKNIFKIDEWWFIWNEWFIWFIWSKPEAAGIAIVVIVVVLIIGTTIVTIFTSWAWNSSFASFPNTFFCVAPTFSTTAICPATPLVASLFILVPYLLMILSREECLGHGQQNCQNQNLNFHK